MSDDAAQRAVTALSQVAPVEALPAETGDLRRWLAERVAHLLHTHPALLMSHLYRVDVREADVQAALAAPDPAGALADALIAREVEKHRYRESVKGEE